MAVAEAAEPGAELVCSVHYEPHHHKEGQWTSVTMRCRRKRFGGRKWAWLLRLSSLRSLNVGAKHAAKVSRGSGTAAVVLEASKRRAQKSVVAHRQPSITRRDGGRA